MFDVFLLFFRKWAIWWKFIVPVIINLTLCLCKTKGLGDFFDLQRYQFQRILQDNLPDVLALSVEYNLTLINQSLITYHSVEGLTLSVLVFSGVFKSQSKEFVDYKAQVEAKVVEKHFCGFLLFLTPL